MSLSRALCSGEEHFHEALQLVKEQKLYSEALRLYAADAAKHKVRKHKLHKHRSPCRSHRSFSN